MSARLDTVVAGGTVVLTSGSRRLDVGIREGRVAALLDPALGRQDAAETVDARGLHVLPGLVDPHAHVGLGGPEDWRTETEAAARGGVTTVLNYVIGGSSYVEHVAAEREAADRLSLIDYGLHVVPCTPLHLEELDRYADELGISSFKLFMNFRGNEGAYLGVEGTDDGFLFDYMRRVAARPGAVACVHTENIEVAWKLREEVASSGLEGLAAWDATRPDFVEAEAVYRAAFYGRVTGAPVYVVHMSAAACLAEAGAARRAGAHVWVETCPHYLTHTVDSQVGSLGKVNPPLRHERDVEGLWQGLADGRIQTVGSDHVGRARAAKEKDVWAASAGVPGIGTILTVLLSEGVHRRGLPLERAVEVASAAPARIFGLYPRKGTLEPGADADLVLVDLEAERTVDAGTFGGGSGYSLYEGWTMRGWAVATMLRGRFVFRDGEVVGEPGGGRYLSR